MNRRTSDFFPEDFFRRHADQADWPLLSFQREGPYLDQAAQEAFRSLVRRLVEPGGVLLDLMAGAHSYLPPAFQRANFIGVSLDAAGMGRNPQLDGALVQDLNRFPSLPFLDETFEAVFCTCGVQYLTRPVELFREVNRVIKPGGIFLVSFTGGCFPRLTIAAWLAARSRQRQLLVARYFKAAGNWRDMGMEPGVAALSEKETDGLHAVWASKAA